PCLAFSGDNGGATHRGVTGDKVRVSVRLFEFPEINIGPEDGPQSTFTFDKEEIKNTVAGLAEYFNSRFQFYGRKIEPVFFDGKGDILAEFQGAGQEEAEADAVKAAEEIKPFAELFSITTPYADALSRRQITNVGAPVMSREWYAERRPFAWTAGPDCTFVLEAVSDYIIKRVAGRPAAHAGGNLKGKDRTIGLIVPENPWYQQCADAGEKTMRDAGVPPALRLSYKIDINTLSNQAASVIAKLRDAGITTVVCGCDPAFPLFLTSKAQEQAYEPEWVVTGTAFTDTDGAGQLYQQDQWSRAFGLSFLGTPQPQRGSYGYFAFKAMRPNEEPIGLVDLLYYQLYTIALGVQMAGPALTPETFEAGLYAYPGGTGPAGTWRFAPGRYSPVQDAREIYWDRNKTSRLNNKKGAYVETEPGRRYKPGEWPASDPDVFRGSAE
ncbi:MAG: ABC transporter substrate-binding protein, partial [Acidimicrobiia bacterium]